MKPPPFIASNASPNMSATLVSVVLLSALMTACADTSESAEDSGSSDVPVAQDSEAGGAGGDEVNAGEPVDSSSGVELGIRLLTPFVGVYSITGPWNGSADDEALLVFRSPSDNAESEVVIYDFLPDSGNCYSTLPAGIASKEPVGERIFLDRVLQFDDAILSLSGTTLVIEYFDTFDFDRDGDSIEQIRYQASSVGLMETDIQPICP